MIEKNGDLPQESWGRADELMPKDYLESVLEQINAIRPVKDCFETYDPKNIWDVRRMADIGRDFAISHPREGQPDWYERRITPWADEAILRKDEIRTHWAKTHIRA